MCRGPEGTNGPSPPCPLPGAPDPACGPGPRFSPLGLPPPCPGPPGPSAQAPAMLQQSRSPAPPALPCLAMGPRPVPAPKEVPDAQGCPGAPDCPAPGWGVGRALAARACPESLRQEPWPRQCPDKMAPEGCCFFQFFAQGSRQYRPKLAVAFPGLGETEISSKGQR